MFAGNVVDGTRLPQSLNRRTRPTAAPREPIRVRPVPAAGSPSVISRSHSTPETDTYLAQYTVAERVSVGSSLKFCLVAAGEADLYPRLGPTMEWDTAAGHAVLRRRGGQRVGSRRRAAALRQARTSAIRSSSRAARCIPLPLAAEPDEHDSHPSRSVQHLKRLEAESIGIIREVAAEFRNPVMLYSIGKDSGVMLHLAMKAFYPSKPPFPLLHVDTSWKFRDMIRHRDRIAARYGVKLLVYTNPEGRRARHQSRSPPARSCTPRS